MADNTICARQNNAPKDVHVRIPGVWEYVTLHGRRDIAGGQRGQSLR